MYCVGHNTATQNHRKELCQGHLICLQHRMECHHIRVDKATKSFLLHMGKIHGKILSYLDALRAESTTQNAFAIVRGTQSRASIFHIWLNVWLKNFDFKKILASSSTSTGKCEVKCNLGNFSLYDANVTHTRQQAMIGRIKATVDP